MSVTNCSYEKHVKPFLPIKDYTGPEQADRIVYFEYTPDLIRRGFDIAPMEIKDFLIKYHTNPTLWFRGELIKYVWRETENTKIETDKIVSRIPFECGPIVGIHVRRTDKTSEAKLHEIEDYMKWVDFWFEVMEDHRTATTLPNCTKKRMLFVASDLPVLKDVVAEAQSKWGDKYEIYHGTIFNNSSEYESREASNEILAVSRILAKCQFLVCTYSSNGCRIIYELMHALQGDATDKAHSIDYIYAQYWNENEMVATTDYKPSHEYPATPEELWAEKGDIIIVKSPIHQDGFIRGKNVRLNTEGNFPMYLLKDYLKFINLSAFANIK